MTSEDITQLAKTLAERLEEDVKECRTREELIRVSARANEAQLLLQGLNQVFDTTELETSGPEGLGLQTD